MDAFTFTAMLAVVFGVFSFVAMIRRARAKRDHSPTEMAVMKTFVVLWLLLVLMIAGLPWYVAAPVAFGVGFAVYRRLYRKHRGVMRPQR